MPRIQDEEQLKQFDTSGIKSNILFRERLQNRFKPSDFVRVINIDDEDFVWQYMSAADEDISMSDDGMQRIITRQPAQVWMIAPGDTDVLQGDNAYIMIEALYKKVIAKKIINKTPNQPASMARNFNWSDPEAQEKIIDMIFIGKENPTFGGSNEKSLGTSGRTPATKTADK